MLKPTEQTSPTALKLRDTLRDSGLPEEHLDGGVLLTKPLSWRVGLMPYGGVRDSGNTKEGPICAIYAIRALTEERLLLVRP